MCLWILIKYCTLNKYYTTTFGITLTQVIFQFYSCFFSYVSVFHPLMSTRGPQVCLIKGVWFLYLSFFLAFLLFFPHFLVHFALFILSYLCHSIPDLSHSISTGWMLSFHVRWRTFAQLSPTMVFLLCALSLFFTLVFSLFLSLSLSLVCSFSLSVSFSLTSCLSSSLSHLFPPCVFVSLKQQTPLRLPVIVEESYWSVFWGST